MKIILAACGLWLYAIVAAADMFSTTFNLPF